MPPRSSSGWSLSPTRSAASATTRPHGDTPFKAGDTLTLYVEPVGFGTQQIGDDIKSALAADIEIRTPGGLVLAKADNFGGVEWSAASGARSTPPSPCRCPS